jgi:hypothetical protein
MHPKIGLLEESRQPEGRNDFSDNLSRAGRWLNGCSGNERVYFNTIPEFYISNKTIKRAEWKGYFSGKWF